MEFKEVARIWNRMCAEVECISCPLRHLCSSNIKEHADKTEAILAKWAEEHPEKTIADDFLEKHPKATTYSDGTPFVCAGYCGYGEPEICHTASEPCILCWRRPLEEVEG